MSYKYKLNFYNVRDLKLFPKILTEFASSVVIAMVPEDNKDREIIKENEDGESMYTLDISPLTSNKLRTIVIQDLIESIDGLAIGDEGYYDTYNAFLSSIKFDMLNSKITLRSDSSLSDSIKSFNNNGLLYKYYSTLSYELNY